MTARLTGHIRDVSPHALAISSKRMIGGSIAVPPTVTMPARIVDQSGNNCTNFGYGWLVESWASQRGVTCAPLSKRASYTIGREISAADSKVPLVDLGASPRDVVEGMRVFGVVPETVCPGDDPTIINDRVDFPTLQIARLYRVTDIGVVLSYGDARCAEIRRCLAAGFPVGFGMTVDSSYESWGFTDAAYAGPTGALGGGHAQRIVGYRPGAFLVANSWGLGWGSNGFAWLSDAFIGGDNPFDFYALRFTKVTP